MGLFALVPAGSKSTPGNAGQGQCSVRGYYGLFGLVRCHRSGSSSEHSGTWLVVACVADPAKLR